MPQVVPILFGAAFTVATCVAMGELVLRRLKLALFRQEAFLFCFLTGAPILSLATLLLYLVHQARPAAFLCVGLTVIGAALFQLGSRPARKSQLAFPIRSKLLFLSIFTAYSLIYLINALAPEITPGGSGYELGNVARLSRANGFVWDFSGLQMPFLFAYSFGRGSAAALVHLVFLAALPLLILCYGTRFGQPKVAIFAALLVFASPVVGIAGSSVHDELGLAASAFAVFYLFQIWNQERTPNLLLLIALLAAFCCFLVHVGHETSHRPLRQIWQLAVRGKEANGLVGPIFLLTPLPVLLLWWQGNRSAALPLRTGPLLLAAALFAIPAFFDPQARYLIPALPFLALALGASLLTLPRVLITIAVLHSIASWPGVVSHYCDRTAWRIRSIPIAAALRVTPEAEYLQAHLTDYALKPVIENLVPPEALVFSLRPRADAYFDRTIITGNESALGSLAADLLAAPLDRRVRPRERSTFRFLPVATRAVRALQTGHGSGFWTIAELRPFFRGKELERSSTWRVRAAPNASIVPLAFDNSYATRWSSGQPMRAGMFVAIDFNQPQTLDELVLEEAPSPEAKVQIDVSSDARTWIPLSNTSEVTLLDLPSGLRQGASRELKARGISYLLVNDSDFFGPDMQKYSTLWGVTELQKQATDRLYFIN